MVVLTVVRKKEVAVWKFNTITEAYKFYVKYYATLGEWWYYLNCAHTLLNRVKDEAIMECLFTHCFVNACVCKTREG